jgi:hypothetical protein
MICLFITVSMVSMVVKYCVFCQQEASLDVDALSRHKVARFMALPGLCGDHRQQGNSLPNFYVLCEMQLN